MADNRMSEGYLVTFENCTAFSNIPAGTPVAFNTGPAPGSATQVYTLGENVAGLGETALLGYHFIGVTDEDLSAGDSPVTVWVDGVFKFPQSRSGLDANHHAGYPVWADSGQTILVGDGTGTGDLAIGSIVGWPTAAPNTACYVLVKINPGVFRWSIYSSGIAAGTSATNTEGLVWPKQGI